MQILLIQKATTTPQFSFLTTLINYATADLFLQQIILTQPKSNCLYPIFFRRYFGKSILFFFVYFYLSIVSPSSRFFPGLFEIILDGFYFLFIQFLCFSSDSQRQLAGISVTVVSGEGWVSVTWFCEQKKFDWLLKGDFI